jgi:hypothetical protein
MIRAKKDGKPNVDELIILDEENNAIDFDKEILFDEDPRISAPHQVFTNIQSQHSQHLTPVSNKMAYNKAF